MSSRFCGLVVLIALGAACSKSHVKPVRPEPEAELAEHKGNGDGRTSNSGDAAKPDPTQERSSQEGFAAPAETAPRNVEPEPVDSCGQRITSTLPGASIRVTTERCSYSRAELSEPVTIDYEVRFERALQGVRPRWWRDPVVEPWPEWAKTPKEGCFKPKDKSNVYVTYWIADDGTYLKGLHAWCPDCLWNGGCVPIRTPPADVEVGVYPQSTLPWNRHVGNFYRESRFPPGEYTLTLRDDGAFKPEGSDERELFHMQTTRRITITP